LNNKDELKQDGYKPLGKYDEELFVYYKLNEINNIPGVSYYFLDKLGNIVGEEKFISKKDIGLVVNLHGKISSTQKKIFASVGKNNGKNNSRNNKKISQ